MKKIIHITTVHPADDIRILVKQCQSLSNKFEVYLVAKMPMGSVAEFDRINFHLLSDRTGRLTRILRGYLDILKIVARIRPAVVHFHDPELIPVGLVLRLFGFNVIYDVHEDLPRQILRKHWIPPAIRPLVSRVSECVEVAAGHFFSAIVAATPHIARRFRNGEVHVVRNLPLKSEIASWQANGDITRNSKALVYLGGLSVARGLKTMLDVLEKLVLIDPEYTLTLAGKFESSADEALFNMHSARKQVDFVGWVSRDQLGPLLSNKGIALILLEPYQSYIESLPIKLFEYVGAGLPIVASDFDVWKSVFGEGTGLFYTSPTNVNEIVMNIQFLQKKYSHHLEISRANRKKIDHLLNWEHESKILLDLYNKLVGDLE